MMKFNKNFYKTYVFWLGIIGVALSFLVVFDSTPPMFSTRWWIALIVGIAALLGIIFVGPRAVSEANKNKKL
ncbi:MAG: hypothetical protein LKF37_13925 [Lentilactobacillus diolivorans]|jgi:cell division protein FtsW (lipid II flippase)|nr:hypothetical protein [Lentilactobacillus diolivorans]